MNKLTNEWQAAFSVIASLENFGYEAVVVGGAVRDKLLGRAVHDVDVATSALPEEVKQVFSNTVDVGIAHGTVLVVHPLAPVEVTTFRTDGEYTDHRRPEAVKFVRSLEEDLLRRDFTINAMALRSNESIVDPYGGQLDLNAHIIRAVGDADARFKEDALRMLRAVRFAAQLGFAIEEKTLIAIRNQANDIHLIAKERVKAELDKIWVSPFVYEGLSQMGNSGLANWLDGDFHAAPWDAFKTSQSEVGWAYFALVNREQIPDVLRHYRLSKREMEFVKAVHAAYDCLIDKGWGAYDYFRFEERVLLTAYEFALYQAKPTGDITPFSIGKTKSQLPIQTKAEIVVNGLHLEKWAERKRGPWLKDAIEALILAVVNEECRNERTNIKEWFMNEYLDKG